MAQSPVGENFRASPYSVIPPLKDTKRKESPSSEDNESKPVKTPILLPDIGEPHPYPFYVGPDTDLTLPVRRKKKSNVPVPLSIPAPLPIPKPLPPAPSVPPKEPTGINDDELTSFLNSEILAECLRECVHRVVWECVKDWGSNYDCDVFSSKISGNPKVYVIDQDTTEVLMRKLFRKTTNTDWPEKCEPIDKMSVGVLSCQAFKLQKARITVGSKPISYFHWRTTYRMATEVMMDSYVAAMEKDMKEMDAKELKQQPPRAAMKSW